MSDQEMDQVDKEWLGSFVGKSIPEDAVIEGFFSIITWINADGERCWRVYNQFDQPVSTTVGILEMAQQQLMRDCVRFAGEGDEDDD